MIDIKVYREYWEGVQKRIPEIKKVLPVTIDEEMSKTIQGLSKEECPVLFILIPSGAGASLSADNVRAVRFFRGLLPAVNGRRNVIRD